MAQDPVSMTVAQELLSRPNHARQRSAFTTRSSRSYYQFDGSDNQQQAAQLSADAYPVGRSRRAGYTSNTWTSSSGDVLSDQDEIDDRTFFVLEYNRLARKHGVRSIVPEEHEPNDESLNSYTKQASWFSRKILRRTSSSQSMKIKQDRYLKHMRSISDSLRMKSKRDKLKDMDLQALVRLCGLSLLYLPTEYAAGSLAVPTCFRATAQFLIQHAPSTRGVFRIPGSQNAVAALYNHYCSMDEEGQVIAGTVRCPTLPDHIRCDTHDVASAFKKFIAGVPGGILGSLALFNAFISIQTQLHGDAELTRTKQSKVRARLIALAVATLRSQYRRELICAVFGLLSMIGRAAETAPREDERGRPLPTSGLMGYGPLGIVFGPLLVGDLLEDYTVRLVNPHGGLILLPISPPKSRKERSKKTIKSGDEGAVFNNHVDKIKVANSITEMLITHWRDVVRHMKNLSALKVVAGTQSLAVRSAIPPMLRPSASETFAIRKPPDWDEFASPLGRRERSVSPTPNRRRSGVPDILSDNEGPLHQIDNLKVKKQRARQTSHPRMSRPASKTVLSPTLEESPKETSGQARHRVPDGRRRSTTWSSSEEEAANSPQHTQSTSKGPGGKHASNSSSDKENKLPKTQQPSARGKVHHHDHKTQLQTENVVEQENSLNEKRGKPQNSLQDSAHERAHHHGHHERSQKTNSVEQGSSLGKMEGDQQYHSPKPDAHAPSETVVRTAHNRSEGTSTAKYGATTTPFAQNKGHSPKSSRKEATKSSGGESRNSKTDTHEGPNKLTKSAERAQKKESKKAMILKIKLDNQDTPSKKSKKSRSSALKSSTAATDSSNQVMQVGVHDKFWPFDQMPGSVLSNPHDAHHSKLEITISRAPSRDLGGSDSKNSRKIGGSEPGLQPHTQDLATPRGMSRSLDDNLRRKNKLLDVQRSSMSKDPLTRVSHEEDIASLAKLAQALEAIDASTNGSGVSTSPKGIAISVHQRGTVEYKSQTSTGRGTPRPREQQKIVSPRVTTDAQGKDKQHDQQARVRLSPKFKSQNSASASSDSPLKRQPVHSSEELNSAYFNRLPESATRASIVPDTKTTQFTPRKRTGSPRSPSAKISALVAKYDTADARSSNVHAATASPTRSPAKTLGREISGKKGPFEEGLVATYISNPPSPTRSQMSSKSGKSEKTPKSSKSPKSRRTPESAVRPLNFERNTSPTKISAPRRILRTSLEDTTPLRPVRKSVENAFPSTSPSKIPRAKVQPNVSPQKSFDGSASKDASRNPSQAQPPEQLDPTASVVQRVARSTPRAPTPPPNIRRSLHEVMTEIRGPAPSLLHPGMLRSVRELTEASEEGDTAGDHSSKVVDCLPSSEMTSDATKLDGPAGELRIHPMPRQHTEQPLRISRSISGDLPTYVHPESPFRDTFSNHVSPTTSPPPSRKNSVLYHEIKRLQQQLVAKTEEALQLKQQLEARKHLDIGSLSEELREAKKDLEKWKTRAKLAEKQLEIVFKAPSRSTSTQLAYSTMSRFSDRADAAKTDGPSDSLSATEKLRKVFNGTDGAASEEGSQDSTDTVVRDVRDVITGSEYTMWVKQTMSAFDATDAS